MTTLAELLANPPDTDLLAKAADMPDALLARNIANDAADWIDAVVAAHTAETATTEPEGDTPNAPAWVHAVLPSEIVRQRQLGWPDFHPEDFCHVCGRRNPVWSAPAADWSEVNGDGHAGIYCPSCWAAIYQAHVGTDRVLWTVSTEVVGHTAKEDEPDTEWVPLADVLGRIAAEGRRGERWRIVGVDPDTERITVATGFWFHASMHDDETGLTLVEVVR